MEITSGNKDLRDFIEDDSKALRKLGQKRAKQFRKRVAQLQLADNLEELRNAIGHFHELIDNRKGQWACDLDQPYRLIFEPKEKPIPTDPDGKYIWIEIKAVELIEVVDYHGK